jgi:ribonuclease HI
MALMAAKRSFGKTWGLKPRMVHWLYTTVVRPIITYGCLVWWPKVEQAQAKLKLNSVQRLACICITGAIKSTSTTAMETLLNMPPLDIFIKGEARMGAYRLELNNNWIKRNQQGHARITSTVTNPLLDMGSDRMLPKLTFDKPFKVLINWEEWKQMEQQCLTKGLVWYTDGSKTDTGTGAGIHGETQRCNIHVPLGKYTTVFQAEIHAIAVCVRENVRRAYKGKHIYILSDSQAGLKALACHEIRSKMVWECVQDLVGLAKHNRVTLVWVPGHRGITGNEAADALARKGSEMTFTGPEPVFGISKTTARGSMLEWVKQQHRTCWNRAPGNKHGKRMMRKPSQSLTTDILQLNRTQIRIVTGLITGHGHLRKHLHTMGIFREEPICRLCNEEEETASHVIFECVALARRRHIIFGIINQGEDMLGKNLCKGPTRPGQGDKPV